MDTAKVLLSELSNLQNYYERLILVAGLEQHLYISLIRRHYSHILQDTHQFLANDYGKISIIRIDLSFKELATLYRRATGLVKNILFFMEDTEMTCNYINNFYIFLHDLHLTIFNNHNYDVEFPKQVLLESQMRNGIPIFFLDVETINNLKKVNVSIDLVEWKREEFYNRFVLLGQEAVCCEQIEKALQHFKRALSYRNSAEVNSSLSFCYAILGMFSEAKIHCLKAIDIDPDYGPPYNDYGTYLVKEGNLGEALDWFTKAKSCTNNPSREYPYINTGKIFLAKHEYEKALAEFENARMISPDNEEIPVIIDQIDRFIH
jgi:tetratricopeptide (TPR) repeat protein